MKREIFEELSLEIDLRNVIFVYSYEIEQGKKKLYFFLCFKWKGKILSKENQEFNWIKIDEFQNYKMLKSNYKIINYIEKINFLSKCK